MDNNYASEIWDMISGGTIDPRMIVFGCGGAGSHIISRLSDDLKGIPRVAVNTDLDSLKGVDADRRICVGKAITFGMDSRGFPEVAERAAELAGDEIKNCLISKDIVFLVAAFGGGSGTGIAPYVARTAKGLGLVPFGIVVLPFSEEGDRRQLAENEVDALREVTESTIVLDNDNLRKFGDNVTLDRAFHIMDRMVLSIINDVADRMSRNFMAAIADEIIAYHSEIGNVPTGSVGYGTVGHAGGLAVGMNAPTPGEFDTPEHQLVNMGGLFQRI